VTLLGALGLAFGVFLGYIWGYNTGRRNPQRALTREMLYDRLQDAYERAQAGLDHLPTHAPGKNPLALQARYHDAIEELQAVNDRLADALTAYHEATLTPSEIANRLQDAHEPEQEGP
jgi:hypothetical protein